MKEMRAILAEHDAEVARKAFLEGSRWCWNFTLKTKGVMNYNYEEKAANEYAERVQRSNKLAAG